MSTTDDETTGLTESAAKLMNWARNLATMTEAQYLVQYRKLSAAAKRQLISVIRYHQTTCLFPWRPPVSESGLQELSPPITHDVPSSSRDGVPAALLPTTIAATDVNMNNEEENANNNQQEAPEQTPVRTNRTNRRRRRASANSNECNGFYPYSSLCMAAPSRIAK
jgi:hypothetical protein